MSYQKSLQTKTTDSQVSPSATFASKAIAAPCMSTHHLLKLQPSCDPDRQRIVERGCGNEENHSKRRKIEDRTG